MKSYLKFLSRNKLYTAIEAVGLVISLAFVILIGSYVAQQWAVVYETPDYERIYGLGTADVLALSWSDKESLESQIPEIEAITRISYGGDKISYNGNSYHVIARQVDPGFFDLFPQYTMVEGSSDCFEGGHTVIISKSFSATISKDKEVIGHPIQVDDSTYIIGGIMEDVSNSFISYFDVLIPTDDEAWRQIPFIGMQGGIGSHLTLFRRAENTDEELFRQKVLEICSNNHHGSKDIEMYNCKEMFFHPASSNFINEGNLTMLRTLTLVVLLLLLSAIFNYVNLNMALVSRRAKEMGTRRLLGAQKQTIIGKYILESILFTAVCFAFALLLAYALVPTMNLLLTQSQLDADIQLRFLLTPAYLLSYIAGIVVLGLLSGLLPALLASHYQPIDIVRGVFRRQSKTWLNGVFITIQNILSIILIALALVMEIQMHHMMKRPLNANTEDLFMLDMSVIHTDELKTLAEQLESTPCVEAFGYGRGYPGCIFYTKGVLLPDREESIAISLIVCDTAYFRLLGLEILEDFGHPMANSMWLGQRAYLEANVSDTSTMFTRLFSVNQSNADYIGGVFKDIPGQSAAHAADEYYQLNVGIIVQKPEDLNCFCGMLIKTNGDHKEAERTIMNLYKAWSEQKYGFYEEPIKYGYIDDLLAKELEPAKRTMRLLELFMLLSVLLSMLGLVAMSTYYSGENTQSVAVRKAFGSDVRSELWRTVRGYMLLVGIAAVIAVPVAVWASGKYLERYAYRIEHYGWIIILAVVISMLIAFLSVFWQTLRAAKTNPAEALKKE